MVKYFTRFFGRKAKNEEEQSDLLAKCVASWVQHDGAIQELDLISIFSNQKEWPIHHRIFLWFKRKLGKLHTQTKYVNTLMRIYKECINDGFLELASNQNFIYVNLTTRGSNLLNFSGYWKEVWTKHEWFWNILLGGGVITTLLTIVEVVFHR